jgi:hypothetical protein
LTVGAQTLAAHPRAQLSENWREWSPQLPNLAEALLNSNELHDGKKSSQLLDITFQKH